MLHYLAKAKKEWQTQSEKALESKKSVYHAIRQLKGIKEAFPHTDSFNELVLETDIPTAELLAKANSSNISPRYRCF